MQRVARFLRHELAEFLAAQVGIDSRFRHKEADQQQYEEDRNRPKDEANPWAWAAIAGTGGYGGHVSLLPLTKRRQSTTLCPVMLELKDVSLQMGNAPDDPLLLSELSLRFPKKHFTAILGPSGCG